MDSQTGRFKRVSAAEARKLREIAERQPGTPGAWSPGELSPTIGRYHSFVDPGMNSSELPFQSPINEEEEKQPVTEESIFEENPTLARLNGERNRRIGRAGEIERFVNGADMEQMEPRMFDSLSNEYHSMGQMLEPLCKSNKAVEVLCKQLEKRALEVTGSILVAELNEFVKGFMTLLSCGAYPAVASMIHILSKWNDQKWEGTVKFTLSRKILKVWRDYAFSSSDTEMNEWKLSCREGTVTGMISDGPLSTYGSPGFKRLCVMSDNHAMNMDVFLVGLTDYLGFVEVGDHSAQKAYDAFNIDVTAEAASGRPHGNRQPEDMEWDQYIEGFESKLEYLEDEIEITGDFEFDMSERKIVMLLKEGMSKKMWIAVEKVLEKKKVLWKSLDLAEAKKVCTEAKKDKVIKDTNFKQFRSFGTKRSGDRGSGQSGSGGSNGSGIPVAGAEGEAVKEAANNGSGGGTVKKKHSYSCRFDRVGKCKNGADCLFQHESDKGDVNMMIDGGSGSLPKPAGQRDPALGPRTNGSVLMLVGALESDFFSGAGSEEVIDDGIIASIDEVSNVCAVGGDIVLSEPMFSGGTDQISIMDSAVDYGQVLTEPELSVGAAHVNSEHGIEIVVIGDNVGVLKENGGMIVESGDAVSKSDGVGEGCEGCALKGNDLLRICVCGCETVADNGETPVRENDASQDECKDGGCYALTGDSCSLEGVIGYVGEEERILVGFDTQAGPSVADTKVDLSQCEELGKDNFAIQGAGGQITKAGTLSELNIVLGYGGELMQLPVRQIPLGGRGAELLIGRKEQKEFVEAVSVRRGEVKLGVEDGEGGGYRKVLLTHSFEDLRRRMGSKPITVAVIGDGISTLYVALMLMGFQVRKYYACEKDPTPRKVSNALVGSVMDRSIGDDVMYVTREKIRSLDLIDLLVMTPDCGPWSCLLDWPPGMEGVGGDFFMQCGEVKYWVEECNPLMFFVAETNQVSGKRGAEWKEQQEQAQCNAMDADFEEISALEIGLGVSRYRRFATNIPRVQINYIEPGDPDDCLDLGWVSKKKPGGCIVATRNTRDPMMVRHEQTYEERFATANEADRLMGYDAGLSCAFGEVELTQDERLTLIGKAVCLRHYVVVLSGLDIVDPLPSLVFKAEILEADPWKLQLFLFDKTDVELEEWVIKMKGDMVPPKFKLNVDPDALRYKCNTMFEVPEGMCDAVLAKMASKCKKKQFEKLEATTNEDWESPMFHQLKEGRIDPLTGAQDCRILCACVYLNDKNKPEDWMKEFSPTVDGFLREFMQRDKYFAKVDDWDAFEIVKVDDASKKYLVFVFKLRGVIYKYRALCMIQGCNTSALFYPVFKHLIFNQILGRCWKIYWSIYQDDTIPKGMSIEEVAGRLRILLMIYKVFDIEVSPKCYDKTGEIPITQQVKAAGYVLSEAGISCGDEFYDVMVVLLTKVIRSIKQLESLIGSLLQAHVAFRFDIDQIAIFGELMAMLQVVLKRAKAGGKIQYNEEIKPVCEELLSFVKILPLVKCLPEELIDDQHCLIYLRDIGDTGKGMLVYRVGIPDAREVVIPDDLQEPNLTQLVRSFHGVLSSDELKWLTVENEANNVVQSLKKTSGMLVSACSGYPANGVQKVGVYSDSSSAVLGVSSLICARWEDRTSDCQSKEGGALER